MGERKHCGEEQAKSQAEFARQYWPLIPDAEYFAICYRTWRGHSRPYGERIYAYFRIIDGQHAGNVVRLMCSPSVFPTSNFYRAWCIARGGPPRSRNTKMSHKTLAGKIYRIRTATVRPRHRVTCPNGKTGFGDFLPELLWYSKVDCILSLEATAKLPVENVTNFSSNPSTNHGIQRGEVWGVESGARDLERTGCKLADDPNPGSGNGDVAAPRTPLTSEAVEVDEYAERRALLKQQAKELLARGAKCTPKGEVKS